MQSRRIFLKDLLGATAAAAFVPSALGVAGCESPALPPLEAIFSGGGTIVTFINRTDEPVQIGSVFYGSFRNGSLWVSRIDVAASTGERFNWARI